MHQPQYLPWLGYFEKIDACDVFVVVDDVQFEKDDWQNRNKVRHPKSRDGWLWLTVPVRYRFPQPICEVAPDDNQPWRRKHLKTLAMLYSRAPFFRDYYPGLEEILMRPSASLVDLNVALLGYLFSCLGIEKEVVRSSSYTVNSHPSRRLLELCKLVGADEFLLGTGSLNYLDSSIFATDDVTLRLQDYQHPRYSQFGDDFVSHLSVVDLLFHHGPESLALIQSGRRWVEYPTVSRKSTG